MNKIKGYISKLEEVISDTENREKNVINLVSDIFQNEETIYNEEINDILCNFALEIDDYEPNLEERKTESYYFGDEELLIKVNILLGILRSLKEDN